MDILILLIPIALGMGLFALAAFMWALRSGQFDDPEGAANRVLVDDEQTAQLVDGAPELSLEDNPHSR